MPRRSWRATGAVLLFALSTALCLTATANAALLLPDNRGWELVSPPDKNGGRVAPPGSIAGGALLQAAPGGGAVTYSSSASFGAGAQGAPPASQYIASRTSAGWSTQNITAPIFSGSYDLEGEGVPYRLFSTDLSRGLLLNGDHCRGEGEGCAVANPPLAGSGAPEGYQNYYLRTSSTGSFSALLGTAALSGLDPARFDLSFAGATTDLSQIVLSTCAALTADATKVPLGEGCDPAQPNLYLWSAGGGLSLINVLPAQSTGTPGAQLAAQSTAISAEGSRVYWRDLTSGNLYLREGTITKQVDLTAGGGGSFETASSADGSVAYFTKAGHLWRYVAATDSATDLTPSGGVTGVLGASADGGYLYYQDAAGLKLWQGGTTTTVAPGASASDPGNYPPTTGTARVSEDGSHLLFTSKAQLTGYDNTDKLSALPDSELFLYDANTKALTCVSCNPTGTRPLGPSSLPGSIPNGASTNAYKPRALSANGRRVFFDSQDVLVVTDTNAAKDVYQWEAQGEGSCAKAGGCIALISDGRDAGGSAFADASADGADTYFLTAGSLVSSDPGSIDLYVARVGGGFPEPPAPIPCEGDACQVLPSEPVDPTLTTLLTGLGNPPVRYHRYKRRPEKEKKPSCKRGKGAKQKPGCKGKGKGNKGKGGARRGSGR